MARISHKKSKRRIAIGCVLLVLFFVISLLWTMPLSVVNSLLPDGIKLLNVTGNVHHGQWKDVQINGRQYPLSCQFQRQSLSFSQVVYLVNCKTPFAVDATVTASPNGDFSVEEGIVSGDVANAERWLALLGVPVKLSGEFGVNIAKAEVKSQLLTELNITGGAQHIHFFGTPLLQQLRIETLNAKLTTSQPIILEMRTKHSDNDSVKLYATSEIDGKNYVTTGEISGKQLENYAPVLRFFGQQTGYNRFAIHLKGNLL